MTLKNQIFKFLFPFAILHGILRWAHKIYLESQIEKKEENLIPLVVVGGLRSGGSGKTGVTVALIQEFQRKGLRLAVISYWMNKAVDRKTESWETVGENWQRTSDESVLIKQKTGVDVYVTRNRYALWKALSAKGGYDLLISDDGFQDSRLKGAYHLVLKAESEKPHLWDLLPCGPFRETYSALSRANKILLGPELCNSGQPPSISSNRFYRQMILPSGLDLSKPCIVICALGNQIRFLEELRSMGLVLKHVISRRDHKSIPIEKICRAIERFPQCQLVTTEKDQIKMIGKKIPLFVIREKIVLPQNLFQELLFHWNFGNFI